MPPTNYNGATLTLVRNGGTNADDVFSETGTLDPLTEGGTLTVDATNIGAVTTNSGGTLLLTFDANATNALVNSALQKIAYSNSSEAPPTPVQIDYTIDDGNVSAQGTGGALTGTGSISVTVITANDPPINTVPGTQTIDEDNILTFSTTAVPNNEISISDADAGTNQVKVYLIADKGTLTLAGTSPFTGLTFTTGDGTDDASIVFTGTITDINTALEGMIFTPQADFNGTGACDGTAACVQILTNDQGNTGGGALIDDDTVAITINAINDIPINTVPTAQTMDEDTTLTFSTANSNLISISDDAGTNPVQVTLTATDGTLTLAGTSPFTSLTFTTGDGTDDASMIFTGTVDNINTALDGISFSPTAEYSGAASVQIDTDDQGNTGTGGILTNSDTVNITVNAVNDTPVNNVPGTQTMNEDDSQIFNTANSNLISISDDAGTNPVQVTLTATSTLTLSGTTGLTFSVGDGTDDTNMAFTGTITDINAALDGMSYTPTADYNGTGSVQIVTNDQGNTGSTGALLDDDTVSITINPINDAPIFTSTAVTSIDEDSLYSYSIVTSDIDGDTLTITDPITASWLTLVDNGNGTGTLSGTPTNSEVGTHNVTLRVNDGTLDVDQTFTITVNAVNDAPINSVPSALSVDEDTTLTLSTANSNLISISDEDAGGADVQVTLTATNGTLTLADTTSLTFNTGTGTNEASMEFTGTVADINTALDGMIFTPTAGYNGSAGVQIVTDDQGNTGTGGALTDDDTVTITVNADNDAPVNSVPTAPSVNEDTTLTLSTANANLISISDEDAGSNSVQVKLTATDGTLTLADTTSLTFIIGDGSDDANMIFTGAITDINTALEGMSFIPTADYNGSATLQIVTNDQGNTGSGGALSADDTVTITVNAVNDAPVFTSTAVTSIDEDRRYSYSIVTSDIDGDTLTITDPTTATWLTLVDNGNGTGTLSGTPTNSEVGTHNVTLRVNDGTLDVDQTFTITVNAVNDAPINSVPTTAPSVDEDTTLTFTGANLISISDADAGSNEVQVTLTATNGTLTLADITGLTITAPSDGTDDAEMVFTGTMADINAALDGMSYTPTADFNGAASVQIVTNDQGNTGSGGALSDDDTVSITVNAVNDAPVFTSTEVTSIDEDSLYSYSIVTNDVDGDALTITDPTTATWLTLADNGDGTGTLSGTPTNSEVGTHNVTLRVTDGTLDVEQTFIITVNAVNDAPINSVPTAAPSVDEDTALTFTDANLISISDADAGSNSVKVTLTAINGILTLAGTSPFTGLTFTTGDGTDDASMVFTGTETDINIALDGMIFTPTANYSGPANVRIVTDDQGNTGGSALIDDDTVDITIDAINDPPTFISTPVTLANEDNAYSYSIVTSDVDTGDTLTITATTLPDWLSFANNGNGIGTLSGTPTTVDVGAHNVTLRVSDGTAEATQSFTVTVFKINDAPVFTSTAVTEVNEDSAYSYNITTNDVDANDFLTITALTTPSWLSLQDNGDGTGTLSGTPTNTEVGTHNVILQVSDGAAQTEQSFTVTVIKMNDAPVFTSTAVTAVEKDSAYNYSIVTSDADGDTLTITAPTTPIWLSLTDNGDGTGTLTGTPTESEVGTHDVTLRVSDGSEQTDQSFTVTVSSPNKAPVNTVPGTQNVAQNATLTFSVANGNPIAISDEDAGANAVLVTLTATNGTLTLSGIDGLTFTAGDGTDDANLAFTGTITGINTALEGMSFNPTAGFSGEARVQIVTHDQGHTGSGDPQSDDDTVIINVNVSSVPLALTLTVEPASFSEALGTPSIATVTRSDTNGVLTVTLSSSDTTEVTVPQTVEIADTQSSASFNVNAVNDTAVDGTQTVTITASATGYTEGTTTVSVTDDDVPPIDDFPVFMTLSVTSEGNGTVTGPSINCPDNCFNSYNNGTKVTLIANPDTGWQFVGWKGQCDETGSVIMTTDKECKAIFAPPQLTLTVEKDGDGTVTSEPAGIDCGEDCSEAYDKETEVTLTATPETGFEFKGWEGDCQATDSDTTSNSTVTVAVTMDTDKTCKANFAEAPMFTLTVEKDGEGTVTSELAGIDCGEDCSEAYDKDTEVTLTATPKAGWQFEAFQGQCNIKPLESSNAGQVTMTIDQVCEAHFVQRCSPNGLMIDTSGQVAGDSESCFTGSLTAGGIEQPNNVALNYFEGIDIKHSGTITADPEHVGKSADILVMAAYRTLLDRVLFARDGQDWVDWERQNPLPSVETITLPKTAIDVAVFDGNLIGGPGEYTAFIGYRLEDGTIHYNGIDPQRVSIGNAASVDMGNHSELCFSCNEAQATDYFQGYVRNQGRVGNHLTFTDSGVFEVASLVRVDSQHLGQSADIFITVTYQSTIVGLPAISFMRDGNDWQIWDGQLDSLAAAKSYTELPERFDVPVYQGPLAGLLGEWTITVGYRLDNGMLVYGLDPIHVAVEAAAQ